jgi:ribonucleotide reductase beta subunit family protein with ferritin-like domain
MKIEKFLLDLEIALEIEELKKIGLTEEEIQGYFQFYADDWISKVKPDNIYTN